MLYSLSNLTVRYQPDGFITLDASESDSDFEKEVKVDDKKSWNLNVVQQFSVISIIHTNQLESESASLKKPVFFSLLYKFLAIRYLIFA